MSHPEVLIRAAAPLSVFEGYIADLRRLSDHWHEAEVLFADAGGRIGGSVLLYADASTEDVGLTQSWSGFGKLAVHPQMRSRGLGRGLTQASIDSARRHRAPTVSIHTAFSRERPGASTSRWAFAAAPSLISRLPT
jgi:predicted N-acetyltransferase YhbS